MPTPLARSFWIRTRRLTALLLAVWLLISLLGPWFARDLDGPRWLGFSLGYWLVAQGALLMFLAVIVVYDLVMRRAEARYLQATSRDVQAGSGSDAG